MEIIEESLSCILLKWLKSIEKILDFYSQTISVEIILFMALLIFCFYGNLLLTVSDHSIQPKNIHPYCNGIAQFTNAK